jgi:hypothetical protein
VMMTFARQATDAEGCRCQEEDKEEESNAG